jgi:4-carboxymuconolactone decarboxylase
MPRIDPIRSKDQLPPEHHAAFDQLVASRGGITGPSNFLLYTPNLNLRYTTIVSYYREDSPISLHHQEVAILTTVREKRSAYPWGGHVRRARDAGVPEAVIDAIRNRNDLDGLDPDDAAIIRYARQLTGGTHVDQPTFDALRSRFGDQWLVELTLLIGHYQGTAVLLNAFELEAALDADPLPDD